MPARVPVTAVLVAHDGSRWLPEALSALAASTVTPSRVVAADTGSTDDSLALLRRGTGHVLELPRSTGYAAAVSAALAAVPADTTWVWLLHDDCAPDPDALSALLRAAKDDPAAAVLGPKAVDWDDPRVLVEIGCTTDGSGVRDTGLEPGELDQGQHDAVRQVLAVGTAGALVRRDVWDALGGLDQALPLFRDDLDLGWRATGAGHRVLVVPQARVRHARAATAGARTVDADPRPATAVDRRGAVRVLLRNAPWLPVLLLRLLLGAVLRASGRLLARRPREAWHEIASLAAVPGALASRRPTRVPRALLSSPWRRARTRVAALHLPERPRPDRAALVLGAVLIALALLAARDVLGRGRLAGGRLLPAPPGAGDLLAAYDAVRDPSLAVLALLSAPLLGRVPLLVDLLLLGCVPLAAAVAYGVAGQVVRGRALRLWAAATWALLPVATGAVAGGRLGEAVVHVALPALLLGAHRLLRSGKRHHAVAYGLALTAAGALAPLLWLLAVLLLGGTALALLAGAAAATRPAARRRAAAVALALAVPPLLLLPWSPQLLDAGALLHGPGRLTTGLADAALPAWHLLLLQPGGPGTPPALVGLGLLLAALGGLLRTRRARVAAAGWGLALAGLVAAVAVTRTTVDGQPVWPGVPLDLVAAGLLLSALIGGEGLQEGLSRSAFGGRQLAALVVVVLAAGAPVVAAGDWLRRGADGPLQRTDRDLLPAFVQAELAARPATRALLLSPRQDGTVGYAVTGPDGPRLGDRPADLDEVVAGLLTPRGAQAAEAAAAEGIAFVAATEDVPAVDAQPGLARQPGERPLWRVVPPARPQQEQRAPGLPLPLQALALLVAVVLAGPGARPRRGLLPEPRR